MRHRLGRNVQKTCSWQSFRSIVCKEFPKPQSQRDNPIFKMSKKTNKQAVQKRIHVTHQYGHGKRAPQNWSSSKRKLKQKWNKITYSCHGWHLEDWPYQVLVKVWRNGSLIHTWLSLSVRQFPIKFNTHLPYGPAIPLLCILWEKWKQVHIETCTRISISAVFMITQN